MNENMTNNLPFSTNPLLGRVKIPGETIRLPSGGIFYDNGELDSSSKNGEIHIYPLSTMSEIFLRSPDMLLNGESLNEVLKQCAPQVLKPGDLLAKDVDYLMTALRKVTYGDSLEVKYKHTCENAKEHTYTISLSKVLQQTKPIDPTKLQDVYSINTPNGQVVKLQPMRFKNVIDIMQSVKDFSNDIEVGEQLLKAVSFVIKAVDEVEDQDMIFEWLKVIPKSWFDLISKAIDEGSNWGPNFQSKATCKDCGQEVELSISLNPLTFFM